MIDQVGSTVAANQLFSDGRQKETSLTLTHMFCGLRREQGMPMQEIKFAGLELI